MSRAERLAIFEADHSASALLKIAATFFDSTSSAAVSARARSLRSNSRSSALDALLVRARGLRTGAGLLWLGQRRGGAQAPVVQFGWIHAVLAAPRTLARFVQRRRGDHRFEPGARESRPARAAGLLCASSRHRSNVCTETPTSRDTSPTLALSGGSNRATTLFLNASPYSSHLSSSSPPSSRSYRGDNYSEAGGGA